MKLIEKIWIYFQRIGFFIVIIASLGTVIGVYYQLYTKHAQLDINVESVNYLAASSNIENLISNYVYKGIPVKNLWLITYRVINSGDVTIVSKGRSQNILEKDIKIKFDPNLEILDSIQVIQRDFPISITKNDSNTISFSFDQWRKNESIIFSIYLKSENKIDNLLPFVPTRPLLDGDVNIFDYSIQSEKKVIPIIDYFPSPIPFTLRIVVVIFTSTFLVLFTFLFIIFLKNWLIIINWKRKNFENFKEFIKSGVLFKNKDFIKESYAKNPDSLVDKPERLDNKYWEYFKGEKIPDNFQMIESWKGFFLVLVFLVLELVVFSSIILSVLKY